MKEEFNKRIKSFCIKLIKKQYLNRFTNGIGKIIEEEDKFVCYVDKEKLDFDNCVAGQLHLYAYSSSIEDMDHFGKLFEFDKPIYYIFDGLEFDRLVLHTYGDVHVIFKNCHFCDSVIMEYANDVTFENNKHYNSDSLKYGIINKYLKGNVKNLRFINDNFYNKDMPYDYGYFNIDLKVDELSIIDTDMNIQKFVSVKENKFIKNCRNISLNANSMVVNNSIINATNVKLNCNEIDSVNSKIIGKNEVIINEEDNKMDISSVNSSRFIYNYKEVVDEKDIVNDNTDKVNTGSDSLYSMKSNVNYEKVNEKIVLKRIELIKTLMKFQNICEEMGIEKSINRTLKRAKG